MARIVGKIKSASIMGINVIDLLTIFAGKVLSEAVFGRLGERFTNNKIIGKVFFFLVGHFVFGSKRWYKMFSLGIALDLMEDITEPFIAPYVNMLYNYI